MARLTVPLNAHLFYSGVVGEKMYVTCEGSNSVLVVDPVTLTTLQTVTLTGAHGMWSQGNVLYVGSITDADGVNSLYAYSISVTGLLAPLSGSPYDLPTRNPHDMVTDLARTKLFVVHSRDSKISVCDLSVGGIPQEPCRTVAMSGGLYDTQAAQNPSGDIRGYTVQPGFSTPMGIARVKPFCDCQTSCFDEDPCTTDVCHAIMSHSENYHCVNDVIPQCGTECIHDVNITVHDHAELTVTEHNGHFEICVTSSYLGENSAVVIGFEPYDPCDLNNRGTCDNRPAIADTIPAYCASEALGDGTGCSLANGDHAISMPGLAIDLLWNYNLTTPTLTLNEDDGTAHLHGILSDPLNPDLVLKVDLWLSGMAPLGTVPLGAPSTPFPHYCYLDGGGLLDPVSWRYFSAITGNIYAIPGTAFEGLFLTTNLAADPFQIGFGANAKNANFGLEGRFVWTVAHQPLDQFLSVSNPIMHATVNVDLEYNCTTQLDYCSLFEEPQENPANGWGVVLNDDQDEIIYCKTFVVGDLVACRSYDAPLDHLFNYTLDHTSYDALYSGRIYATTVLPDDCALNPDEACGDNIVLETKYNLVFELLSSGVISVNFERTDFNFDGHWIRNVWTQYGDLKVVFETRVKHVAPTQSMPHTTNLMFDSIDNATETGYPMHIQNDQVPCDNRDGFCYQTWCLVSSDAVLNEITDFTGFKAIKFSVKINGEIQIYVTVNMYIDAHKLGMDTYVQSVVDAELTLYTDPYFQDGYDIVEGTYFLDCEKIFGILEFSHYYSNLEAVIRKAYVCYSNEIDLLPYDPEYPNETGCNTLGGFVHRDLVYSENPGDVIVGHYAFELLEEGDGIHIQKFCFEGRAITPHGQLLQIEYHGIDPTLDYQPALLEIQAKSTYPVSRKQNRSYDESEDDCDYSHAIYAVHCENGKHYDYEQHRCIRDDNYPRPPVPHDDDDNYPRPPVSYDDSDYSYDNHRHRPNSYDDEDDSDNDNATIIYVLIFFVFLAALFFVGRMFNWFGFFGGVAVVSNRQQQQQVVHNTYVDDRDVSIIGHGNAVTQSQSTTYRPQSYVAGEDNIQQRRSTPLEEQQRLANENLQLFF